jgi:hypothetical protein
VSGRSALAVRGVGAVTLGFEAVMLLVAIPPMRMLGGSLSGAALAFVLAVSLLCAVLAGLLSRPWAWPAGAVPQLALIVGGVVFHPVLAALGVVYGLAWGYVLYMRHNVLSSPPRRDPPARATE